MDKCMFHLQEIAVWQFLKEILDECGPYEKSLVNLIDLT